MEGMTDIPEQVRLSVRLKTIADMVSRGNRVCDVGCDHGFVSIYLVQKNIAPFVLAMDVGKGPLEQARKHIEEAKLKDQIEIRLSDGLTGYQQGEADSLIIAGMGGPLMSRILSDHKAEDFKELILAPQSEITQFRRFLFKRGFQVIAEELVLEDGKYYPMMKAIPCAAEEREVQKKCGFAQESVSDGRIQEQPEISMQQEKRELGYRFGELLLEAKHPVLWEFLKKEQKKLQLILKELERQQGERILKRRNDLSKELYYIEKALAYYECR